MAKSCSICIFIFFIFSCKKNNTDSNFFVDTSIYQTDLNIKWKGKKIYFFQSIVPLKNLNNYKTKFEIVTYYDANCSLCFMQMIKWRKAMKKFSSYDVSFKFILSASNRTSLEINLEKMNFPLDLVYLDEKNEFVEKHNFLLDSDYINSSILLDSNNNVLHIGNPTNSEKVKEKYIEIMTR